MIEEANEKKPQSDLAKAGYSPEGPVTNTRPVTCCEELERLNAVLDSAGVVGAAGRLNATERVCSLLDQLQLLHRNYCAEVNKSRTDGHAAAERDAVSSSRGRAARSLAHAVLSDTPPQCAALREQARGLLDRLPASDAPAPCSKVSA